jgi:ABC-2 type transport system ATP-binding protein
MTDDDGRIVASGLTKTFGTVTAVDGLTFTVEPGTITGFLGPNGAGKTTTLRMLLGLVRPDAGTATIGGHTYLDLPAPASEVGAVLEATAFHPARSGRGHLRIYCTVNGYPRSRADEVLDLVGLADAGRRAVRGYSLGMRQRLGLAAALLQEPTLLVLDEPTNGLDPHGIREMRDLLLELNRSGTTVFLSSHLLAEVEQLCNRVAVLDRGRLVVQQDLAELRRPTGRTVVVTPDPAAAIAVLDGRVVARDGDRLLVRTDDATALNAVLVEARVPVRELRPERRGLEQVVLEATSGSGDVR